MPNPQQVRIVVMTGAVAAITATGAWYGAGLKTRKEFQKEKKIRVEASPAERIAQLDKARAGLVSKRNEIERKIMEIDARSAKAALRASGDSGG